MTARICVVGSANLDLTFSTTRLPRPGETLAAHGFQRGLGGKGANQAVAAARLGAAVTFVARVGNDPFGAEARRAYQADGLDVTHVHLDPEQPTGTAVILVDDHAQNCIVIVPGANAALSVQDVRQAAPAIQAADVLLCQLETPLDTVREALRLARAAGVRTVLTPAPARELDDEFFQLTDLCVPNETEAQQLSGLAVEIAPQAEAAAAALLRRGARAVVITRGAHGALARDADTVHHVPAHPVAAVDPTGAGDAFTAALAVFWAEGLSLPEAARRASRAAAITVTRPGAHPAFPSRAEVDALLE